MKIIIGLGNPGNKYQKNRHNIGWRILDKLNKELNGTEWKKSEKFSALLSKINHNNSKLILVKPTTFMNLSGKAVSSLVNYYKLNPSEDILVVFDDKDILFKKIRIKKSSGSGGHNGIKSIIESIGTQEFERLKFGVGHEEQKIPTEAFVLQDFEQNEEKELSKLFKAAQKKITNWIES